VSRYASIEAEVAAIETQGLRRRLRPLQMTDAVSGLLDGEPVTVFCSNDYLGLANHPAVVHAGGGAGSSRLISGNRPAHEALEERLSTLYGRPATLFSSGYHANLALMSTVLGAGDVVASDALNHASIIDGLRLSKGQRVIMPHAESGAVPAGAKMVVVEGLYSMDGDVLCLDAYTGEHWLAVDEAHAFGVLGPGGRGAAAAQGVTPDFVVGTLGKAIGAYGAFVVGPPSLRELLVSRGRSFIFTTGLPEGVVHQALAALDLADSERRERLSARVRRLRSGLADLGIPALGEHHIVPIVLGDRTMAVADRLLSRGFWAAGIRAPTVPAGQERIRITCSSEHTEHQIDQLLSALEQTLKELA
jgi:7-keto-8-aminopelargonate synthetase-like enzyme